MSAGLATNLMLDVAASHSEDHRRDARARAQAALARRDRSRCASRSRRGRRLAFRSR